MGVTTRMLGVLELTNGLPAGGKDEGIKWGRSLGVGLVDGLLMG